jgi:hypothetical protein
VRGGVTSGAGWLQLEQRRTAPVGPARLELATFCLGSSRTSFVLRAVEVLPGGFEPPLPAPRAGALSPGPWELAWRNQVPTLVYPKVTVLRTAERADAHFRRGG